MSLRPITLLRMHTWKVTAVAIAFALVFVFTLSAAQASGDPYGDDVTPNDGIDGNVSNALGAPNGTYVQVGTEGEAGGSLTVSFTNNVAYDGAGTDIIVHAVADGTAASALIEVSRNGTTFVQVGTFSDASDVSINLGSLGLPFATHVRVTYASGAFPGYNLDAVEAVNMLGEDAVLVATPEADENPGHTEHTVTATVSDGVATQGVLVSFEVISGPNLGDSGTAVTGALGTATFTYEGDGGVGTDLIRAWVEVNGNGNVDDSEPSDVVVKEWHGVTGTIELEDVDGGELLVDDTITVTVKDHDLDTTGAPDTVSVTVKSTTDATGFALLLTETGNSTGVFAGTFSLGEATNAATRVLAAEDDDTITGTYDDALDGTGADPAPVADTLTVGLSEDDEDEDGAKVTICHMPPGNPGNAKTLTVGANAQDAHLGHGDTLGECDEEKLPPTRQEQQRSAFCERRPDHKRCADLETEARSSVVVEDDRDDKDDDDRATSVSTERARLEAFCERKGYDHPRCDVLDRDNDD